VIFKEVLRPPIWVLAFIYFLLLSLVIALWAAFDNTVAFTSFVAATIAIIYIAYAMRSTITFDGEELRIDRAHIESKYLGKVTILDSGAMRLLRTRDADPAAYLAIKFWAPTGIKIEVTDPRDPTPYWLITSKRGEELAALLVNS
jgi:Ca2+/Na+ antiporter